MARRIEVGRSLEELVKGSLEYEMDAAGRAFRARFGGLDTAPAWPVETFPAALIVRRENRENGPDEFWSVAYTKDGEDYAFAAEDAWEPVELAYQPRSQAAGEGLGQMPMLAAEAVTAAPVTAPTSTPAKLRKGGRRFEEQAAGRVTLLESGGAGPRTIRAIGITAGVVNGNRRRYPADTLRAAVADLRGHLHESAGQGRLLLLGEAEHPSTKGGRPDIAETVVKWTDVAFNEQTQQVDLTGHIIETAKGRDILALIEGGVFPGLSQRGYGRSVTRDENGGTVDEVTELTITGYDMVSEPSDPLARVTMLESEEQPSGSEGLSGAMEEDAMNAEQLAAAIRANPDLFKGLVADEVKTMSEAQRAAIEKQLREALGAPPEADLGQALAEAVKAQKRLAELEKRQALDAAISEATQDLKYGDALNKLFAESLKAAKFDTPEQVKLLAEAKRKEYDAIAAAAKLAAMGRVEVVGPVIETATGGEWPEYAKVAFEFTESLRKRGEIKAWSALKPKNRNEEVAAQVLSRFDQLYQNNLLKEARAYDEATTAAGLSLPYGVSRAILGAVWPTLVATSLFDISTTDQAPVYVYYEEYADESGKHVTVTDEHWTTDHDAWVTLTHKRLQPGTVVVETTGDSGTYLEGSDYVVDYTNGKIKALSGGTLSNTTAYHITYHYDSLREGEGSAIQNGKMTLSRALMDIQADRLATQINNEAVVFSRSQIGYDVTARTLASLINEVRRRIDADIMYDALSAALGVSLNSGGTWTTATDPVIDFVSYLGVAKDKVSKRYYEPTGILMSSTRADAVANWDGFTAAGKRPDADLNMNGYLGRLKGLPVFQSTEFSDSYALVFNREMVFHRVYEPMSLQGPFQTYSSGNLVDAQQWFVREYNGTLVPLNAKAAYVAIA